MRTHGQLFEKAVSFGNLLRAARLAQRGKRFRPEVAEFNFDLERNILVLQRELRGHTYEPCPFRTFRIIEPKERLVAAPAYRDRVVHHALHGIIEPIFDRTFIADSYACRKGKGTHRALDRFTHFARGSRYVLRLDVQKYFPSIDHAILEALLRRKIRDSEVLWLLDLIIDRSPEQEAPVHYYPGDNLFTPHERRRGIPIGSLTSQLFANIYLSPLDHLLRERLRWPRYLRYMDDLVLFADDKEELHRLGGILRDFLGRKLRLYVHPGKTLVAPVTEGITFLGFRVWPDRRRVATPGARRFERRLRRLASGYRQREIDLDGVTRSVSGWVAHASFGNSYRLREAIFDGVVFQRGEAA